MSVSDNKNFYITTTLPYVNSDPHLGHAMEFVRADVIARFKEARGYRVFLNTGTDEHGAKVYRRALKEGIDPQDYVDKAAEKFKGLTELLNLKKDIHFIRTSDQKHIKAAQEFWRRCEATGDIYKKNYKTKYCIGCELEKTESELVDGRCSLHQNLKLEVIEEENYFFKFSKYQDKLLEYYKNNTDFVIPDFRFNEIKKFVEGGLQDFSISRLKEKMLWGVPVPGDDNHVMYVWFDALVNYISTLGWPVSTEASAGKPSDDLFQKFWVEGETVQYAGKDNLRQQSAMWQAMLMSAGIKNTDKIVINGFITGEGGLKMSKSLGNVLDPYKIVREFGSDAFRYFVTREISSFEDSPFTPERFKEAYNANLANGLGNLTSRIMKMAETHLSKCPEIIKEDMSKGFIDAMNHFRIQEAMNIVWRQIAELDLVIQESEPFKLIKSDSAKAVGIIEDLVVKLYGIAAALRPILPATAEMIEGLVRANRAPERPLFPRVE